MSFLAPVYLALAAAIAVPLLIHLLRRRIGARIEFPATRYLARAEREHSRTLRIRNLILMLLRVLALLAIAVAAARPVARWTGGGHTPTALAIVVDNSMSTSVVIDGRPLLDEFKRTARTVLDDAAPEDRLWLVTIDGRLRGGSASTLRGELDRLQPLGGAGDPALAIARAVNAVRSAGLGARQIALLTDGQRTEWAHAPVLGDAELLLYVPSASPPANRAVVSAEARPGRWTPRGTLVTRFLSRDSTTYRITLGGRTIARGTAAPNEEVSLNAAPPERGWVDGTVEIEPDELPADNVRHFAVWIGTAPGVAATPGAGAFLGNAVDVLRGAQRITSGNDIAVVAADELTTLPALIVPPSDPVRLGAANRALERAGIPWRFGARRTGSVQVTGTGFDGVSVTDRYDLVAQAGAAADTLASVGQTPWIVAGARFVLVGSPLTPAATNFPVRAAFLPWLGSVLTERLVGEPGQVVAADPGTRIARPRWADAIEAEGGQRTPLGDVVEVPSRTGTYFLSRGERRVGALVVNAPAEESVLDRYTAAELRGRLHARNAAVAASAAALQALAFRGAARRSLIAAAMLLALILLVAEAVLTGVRRQRIA